jgi:hypothetical protein
MDRLLPYDSVVLANVSAGDLRKEQMTQLQEFVGEHGRGLVVIGGDRTFGLGDYADTPLEAALPVTVQPPDKDQTATLVVILVVDRSGSMSNTETADRRVSRMDLAKEGAIQAVETSVGDQVGVIAFDYFGELDLQTFVPSAASRPASDQIMLCPGHACFPAFSEPWITPTRSNPGARHTSSADRRYAVPGALCTNGQRHAPGGHHHLHSGRPQRRYSAVAGRRPARRRPPTTPAPRRTSRGS